MKEVMIPPDNRFGVCSVQYMSVHLRCTVHVCCVQYVSVSLCLLCAVHACVYFVQYMSVFTVCSTCLCVCCVQYMSVCLLCAVHVCVCCVQCMSVFAGCSTCLCLLCAVHVCVCCVQYMSLMAELGEGPPPKSTSAPTSHVNRSNLFHNQMPPNPMVSTGAEPLKELHMSALAQHCMVLACPLLLGAGNL